MPSRVGIHECTFRIDKDCVQTGIVPARASTRDVHGDVAWHGYCYYGYHMEVYALDSITRTTPVQARGASALVTVRLDLNAYTVAFLKNGVEAVTKKPIDIRTDQRYHFAVSLNTKGAPATIVAME